MLTLFTANKIKINKKGINSLFGKMTISDDDALLLKPQTFMNNSGEAVKAACEKFNLDLNDILVLCDDINLELGIIRFRAQGSAGGHKGLKSIIEKLEADTFNRLRIGIGSKKSGVLTDYVLSRFSPDEKNVLRKIINKATNAIDAWINGGIEPAMNRFNPAPSSFEE